jgi:response regulator RpfG family c-di-GMP phosphodiesterase
MALKHQQTIFLLDDEPSILKSLQRLLRKDGYNILTALNGQEGLRLLKSSAEPVSLIISDQRMPEMTGSQFLEQAKEVFPDAIRFLLTGHSDIDAIVEAINKGEIHRYLTKPWNDDDFLLQVRQALEQFELALENRELLELTNKQNRELNELNKHLEKKVEERTQEVRQKNEELEKSFVNTIRLLSSLVGTLDPTLGKYMNHAAQLARDVAEAYGLEKEKVDQIEMAGMIHDIGLLGSPDRIWAKEEKEIHGAELNIFHEHPVIAQVCLDSVDRLSEISKIVLHHHEHYDGSGFPNGLKGDEIPLESRIIGAAADYCRILYTWPKSTNQIIDRARKYLGTASEGLTGKSPEETIQNVAKKIILVGASQKYDLEVVAKLMKIVEVPSEADEINEEKLTRTLLFNPEDLKPGMVLEKDLRIKDGRLLLAKGATLKDSAVNIIQRFAEKDLIKGKICVSV